MRAIFFCVAMCIAWPTTALAEPTDAPESAVKRPKRRAERHSEEQARRHLLSTVVVKGRRQNPMAVFDISRVEPKFEVGTARYSDRAEARERARKSKRVPR